MVGIKRSGEVMNDALSREFFEARHRDLVDRVSPKRLKHIEGVSETATRLAEVYGVDPRIAALAGLLHDWDKGMDDERIRERVREVGLQDAIDPWVVERMPQVLHGPTASAALKSAYPEIPDEIIDAIYKHTTASVEMSDLAKILYVADAIEPSRKFEGIDETRSMIGKVSLDELYFKVYKFWTMALIDHDIVLYPETIAIWNDMAARRTRTGKKKTHKGKRKKRE